ncbi:hypothetical protein Fmac_014409 [Flemingia macrophylla]|uniref:Uncharacterized protein n=1 Tax=Flemingia macrophylla TaxID=520843 RepID=A0ABD1MBP7_9FABA
MSLDEPAQEEQHQQQDPEEEVEDEDEEDDLQKPETLEEDQPHTLEAANHNAEVNDVEEKEENEDPNLGFREVRRDRGLQGRHRQGLRQIERLRLYLVQAQVTCEEICYMLMNGMVRAWKEDFINPSSHGVPAFGKETKECGIRCFHASSQVWAKNDGPLDLKTPKKVKYLRRDHRRQPTVRNVIATKSNPDKTVEIIEGMTLVELAKRSGKLVSSLQDVLINVGEKVEYEFEPLSMDIAELAAMVGVTPNMIITMSRLRRDNLVELIDIRCDSL